MDCHKTIRAPIGLVLLLLLTSTAVLFGPAQAQSTCDQLVLDEANVFGGGIGQVQSAADELVRQGADVRVRTIKTYGAAGNLDRYEAQVEAGCPSWQAPDGSIKNNLVVLMVAVDDRATGLYYGAQWARALDESWPRISAGVINPRFRDGDFSGGFVRGLSEIKRSVTASSQPKPSAGSGAGKAVLAGLVIGALAAGGFIGYRLLAARKRDKESRRAAQQKARLARQGAVARINELPERLQMLEIRVGAVAERTIEDSGGNLAADLAKVKALFDSAASSFADLSHSAGDPDRQGLSVAEYQAMEEALQRVLEKLQEAQALTEALEKRTQELWQAISNAPKRLSEVEEGIGRASASIEAARQQGFKTGVPEAMLAQASTALEQARGLYRDKRPVAALESAREAAALASQAVGAAEQLPQKRERAIAGLPALASRTEKVKEVIEEGAEAFERISRSYAESSWQSIEGNGTEATNRVDWSLQSLEDIKKTSRDNDWEAASDLVQEANAWLGEAETLIASIRAMETNLAAAKRDAPVEIGLAQTDIVKAWQYINAYDEDIRESLEDDLRQAEQRLKQARTELEKDLPDHILALQAAKEANASADKILDQARSEHEAAERLRTRLAGAQRDARIAFSRAEQYIKDHRADVGRTAADNLEQARRRLGETDTGAELAARVAAAEQAHSLAESAYAAARRDVSAAEERRPFRPSGGGRPPILLPGPGRSSTWGRPSPRPPSPGSFGRGGGSIGWGGGHRGGGSTKW